jgi:hypothetical protein
MSPKLNLFNFLSNVESEFLSPKTGRHEEVDSRSWRVLGNTFSCALNFRLIYLLVKDMHENVAVC